MNRCRIPQAAYLRIRAAYVCMDSDSDSNDEGADDDATHMTHIDSDAAVGAGRCAACV